jgi:NAD(P)H dehydrogenase (quinone)
MAITGATGRLGGRVAQRLAADGIPLRLVVRDASRAPALPGAEVAEATYADTAAVEAALTGVDVALMVSIGEVEDRVAQHTAFVDAALAAGVRHLVYTSFVGAAPDATFTLVRHHWATEEHIKASGVTYTFLRDNLYADFFPAMAGDDGVIAGPAGDGRAAVVAQDDIADVAAAVLARAGDHEGATYDLTGPEAINMDDAARILTAALGREIRYRPETVDEAFASRASYGAPDWLVEAWVSTYTAIAAGDMARVTDDVPRLAGHPATSLAQLLAAGPTSY